MRAVFYILQFYHEHSSWVTIQIDIALKFATYSFFEVTGIKPSDVNDAKVGIMNFVTHLLWLTAFALNYWSVLSFYKCIFKDVIGKGGYQRDKTVSRILHGLIFIWYISSVSHYVTLPHEFRLTADRFCWLSSNTDCKSTNTGSPAQIKFTWSESGTLILCTSSLTFWFYFSPLCGLEEPDINVGLSSYICYSSFQVSRELWEHLFVASPQPSFEGSYMPLKIMLKCWCHIGRLVYRFIASTSFTSDSALRPRIDTQSLS